MMIEEEMVNFPPFMMDLPLMIDVLIEDDISKAESMFFWYTSSQAIDSNGNLITFDFIMDDSYPWLDTITNGNDTFTFMIDKSKVKSYMYGEYTIKIKLADDFS